MRFYSHVIIVLLAVGGAHLIKANTTFTNLFVDGIDQGDGTAVRMSDNIPQATFPLPNITTPDMACGVNGQTGVSRIASVNAGSTLTFEWRSWPDGSHPGSIDISHKGPCAVYMKKVADSSASNNAAGDGWFKIMEDSYDSVAGKWCTEKLIPDDGHLAATVPNDLAPGYYLVRPELLALHQADKLPPDPQFYVGCAQIFLNSSGSATPASTVAIPGYINMSTPAMTYDIWTMPLKLPFPDFGPPLYTSASSKRNLGARGTLIQTIGLKPEGCVMENVNWCGFTPPSYSNQNDCYTSSENCSVQTTDCYNGAGPTGSKNCFNWENFCTALRDNCASSPIARGPPSISSFLPEPLGTLNPAAVVAATKPADSSTTPPSDASAQAAAISAMQIYTEAWGPVSPSVAGTESAYPVDTGSAHLLASSSVLTAKPAASGSIDTCGSNGGQTCATDLCCSSQGYCGTSDDYCGSGCQAQFGKCSRGSKHKRASIGHPSFPRGHLMRR